MEPTDTLQHLPEYFLGYGDLRELKHEPPRTTHQTSTYLDELDLDTAQRPVLDWQIDMGNVGE